MLYYCRPSVKWKFMCDGCSSWRKFEDNKRRYWFGVL